MPISIVLVAVYFLAICGVVFAGPIDNARQFQEKAANSASRNYSTKTTSPSIVIKKPVSPAASATVKKKEAGTRASTEAAASSSAAKDQTAK